MKWFATLVATAIAIEGQHDEQILTVADHFACVIEQTTLSETSGALLCWGENDELELESPVGLFIQVSAAAHHACAVSEQGQVLCWGGAANDGMLQPSLPDDIYTQVSVAESHACALSQAGQAACWGRNTHGEATPPGPGVSFSTLSCGGKHSCGLTTTGEIKCWGNRIAGLLSGPPGAYTSLSVSSSGHLCAIDVYSRLHCWGTLMGPKGGHEQWNDTFVAVSAGRTATCAVKGDGDLHCVGSVSRVWPSGAPGMQEPYSEVAAGDVAVCGITATDSSVHCWGPPRASVLSVPPDVVPLGYGDISGHEGGFGLLEDREL